MTPKITCLIPAYKEEAGIAATISSLLQQDIAIHKIVVIVNTKGPVLEDNTADIARSFDGVIVEELVNNKGMKSGAMNHGWKKYAQDADFIMTMDADTTLFPTTVRYLYEEFSDRNLGAVCARYWAQAGSGLAWSLQRLEYGRADLSRDLRKWKVNVASGAAVMYRQSALTQVIERRARKATHRTVGKHEASGVTQRDAPWDESTLIEDYGLTLDLRSLGWKAQAAKNAHVLTDTPSHFFGKGGLWEQRLRWGRGGFDEVRNRGWHKYLLYDISGYGVFGIGIIGRLLFMIYLAMMVWYGVSYQFSWIGAIPLVVMWLSRFTSFLRLNGKRPVDFLVVGSLVIEDLYGLGLEACALVSIIHSLKNNKKAW